MFPQAKDYVVWERRSNGGLAGAEPEPLTGGSIEAGFDVVQPAGAVQAWRASRREPMRPALRASKLPWAIGFSVRPVRALSVKTRAPRLSRHRPCGIIMLMRTTLTLQDDVLKLARKQAAQENRPLKDVINDALRVGLTLERGDRTRRYRFKLKTVKGRTMPGVDLHDRDKLFDLMEGR